MAAGLISEVHFEQFATDLIQRSREIDDEWSLEENDGKIYLRKKTVKQVTIPTEAIPRELENEEIEWPPKEEWVVCKTSGYLMRDISNAYSSHLSINMSVCHRGCFWLFDYTLCQELKERQESEENLEQSDDACVRDQGTSQGETLVFEYHILYSESYSVPVMYFNVHKSDGRLLPLDQIWRMVPNCYQDRLKEDKWTFLTQQEHPYLCRPFYQLHPCHTEALMSCVQAISQPKDFNYLISWLSVVGPVVLLEVSLAYGKKKAVS